MLLFNFQGHTFGAGFPLMGPFYLKGPFFRGLHSAYPITNNDRHPSFYELLVIVYGFHIPNSKSEKPCTPQGITHNPPHADVRKYIDVYHNVSMIICKKYSYHSSKAFILFL